MSRQERLFVDGPRSAAVLSACGTYRYSLSRSWDPDPDPACCFIMLNPSIADESIDDPTIRRVVAFAREWAHGSVTVVNLFAFRSTDPDALRTASDPVGPENDRYIVEAATSAKVVIAAWGAHPEAEWRAKAVRRLLAGAGVPLHCLSLTKGGHPGHPLFLKGGLVPVPLGDLP